MKPKVFIDGQAGTTGLEIYSRLSKRNDIELLVIDEAKRKDNDERQKLMNEADLVFLCLPDAAAIEAVSLITDSTTKVIDASTAHRTNPDWVYGFSELDDSFKQKIKTQRFIANPGCHATGFISIVYPLVKAGVIEASKDLSVFSLTGYSGGGKKMIEQYEDLNHSSLLGSPAIYGLTMQHKHLNEMKTICGLAKAPLFCPVVDDYYRGMATTIMLEANAYKVHEILKNHYSSGLVEVCDFGYEGNIYANTMAESDKLKLIVNGHESQTMITALFDNLGKGACGAAIQNMNLMLGLNEMEGLSL